MDSRQEHAGMTSCVSVSEVSNKLLIYTDHKKTAEKNNLFSRLYFFTKLKY